MDTDFLFSPQLAQDPSLSSSGHTRPPGTQPSPPSYPNDPAYLFSVSHTQTEPATQQSLQTSAPSFFTTFSSSGPVCISDTQPSSPVYPPGTEFTSPKLGFYGQTWRSMEPEGKSQQQTSTGAVFCTRHSGEPWHGLGPCPRMPDMMPWVSIDEQGSCRMVYSATGAPIHVSMPSLMPEQDLHGIPGGTLASVSGAPLMSNPAALASPALTPLSPKVDLPGVPGGTPDSLAAAPSMMNQAAMPSPAYIAKSSLVSVSPSTASSVLEPDSPGVPGETPSSVAAALSIPDTASSSKHLPVMRLFSLQCPSVPTPASPLFPPAVIVPTPAGMEPWFSTSLYMPMHGFSSQPPLHMIPPQGHVMLSGPLIQNHALGLCGENLDTNVMRESFMPEKRKITLYIGKIVPTVKDDFLKSLLELCGSIRSWKRAQDPVTGSPKGFGFCEFESPEGLLRALRLLNRLSLEGQELVLKVDQATRKYLEHYVEKKIRRLKYEKSQGPDTEVETSPGVEATDAMKQLTFEALKEVAAEEEFGLVCDKDREADKEVHEKLMSLLEERAWMNELDPSRSCVAILGFDRVEAGKESVQAGLTEDTRSNWHRVNTIEREWYESELVRHREKGQGWHESFRGSELYYMEYERLWEVREREKEHQRTVEMDRVQEGRKERQRLLKEQEEESEGGGRRKRWYKEDRYDEKRKKWQAEKEEDEQDRLLEQQEIIEAMWKKPTEQNDDTGNGKTGLEAAERTALSSSVSKEGDHLPDGLRMMCARKGELLSRNGFLDQSARAKTSFCFRSSWKQRPVPLVFHQEDEEKALKEEDTEAMATPESVNNNLSNLGNCLPNRVMQSEQDQILEWGNGSMGEDEGFWGRNKASGGIHKCQVVNTVTYRCPTFTWERECTPEQQSLTLEKKRILDTKQIIDMIPRTKDELFALCVDWALFDQHGLHEQIRPWVSKKITEFIGEEEATLVDFIVSSAKKHMTPTHLLELLENIFVEEAELFVMKLWRVVIYEIRKVESGLSRR